MHKRHYYLFLIFCSCQLTLFSQAILPDFTVNNNKGIISASWQNNYTSTIKRINVQRSYDSLKYFTTITSIKNPQQIANGVVDKSAVDPDFYYRLFILFDSNAYIFTTPKKPAINNEYDYAAAIKKILIKNGQYVTSESNEEIPKNSIEVYPSKFVYTIRDNNVLINLPDFEPGKYIVKLYDEDEKLLYDLQHLKEGYLVIEKVNFKHAGWFRLEVFKQGELIEKSKIYIAKD